MNLRHFLANCRGPVDATDDDSPLVFVASTEEVARDGLVLRSDKWRFDAFKRNPVFLFMHDYHTLPIGRVEISVDADAKEVLATVTFDRDDELAAAVERKYRSGFMHAVSVGFSVDDIRYKDDDGKDLDAPESTGQELYELSAVPVPADTGAVLKNSAALAGIRSALTEIGLTVVEDKPDEAQGRALVALLSGQRLAETPAPAPAPKPDLTRVGAVLSRKNRELLENARDALAAGATAIDDVLAAATKPEDEPNEPTDEERAISEAFSAISNTLSELTTHQGDN